MKIKISQSKLKAYTDYKNKKLCGYLFKAKYIDNSIEFVASKPMEEGIYFEYLATGSLPKSNQIPYPKKDKYGNISTDYKRIEEAVKLFRKLMAHFKIKILKVGYNLENEDISGVMDIWAEWDGVKCIIDLKYSGLIDDRWNDLGWDIDALPEKDSLMIQGVHYKILVNDILGYEDVPFYYWIFNSKDPTDMKIIRQNVDPERFPKHRAMIDYVKDEIEKEMYLGFTPYPKYRDCKDCPLNATCDKKEEFPSVEDVYY
jgi:hypothetical protein